MTLPPALFSNQFFWFVTRASGVLALALLLLSAVWGVAIRAGHWDRWMARWDVQDLHRYVSWLACGFLLIHVTALLGDRFVGFGLADLLVPFHSSYAEPYTGLGVVALYLLVAVMVTSYLTRALRYRQWLAWHRLSYVVVLLVLLHALGTGTDRFKWWMLAVCAIGAASLAAGWRARRSWAKKT
ncbi:MAG: ferric reductase-like transmembrane domain-containing protein [Firmicutes bacterium]|nr:ferric reductase-like transmembrane domain-containing protein [Bacillota bacterium]